MRVCQSDEHLWIGVLAEVLDADISGVVIEHIGSGDTLGRYLATGDGEGLHLLAAIAGDANLHLGILRTLEAVHRFLIGDNLAYERLAIYGYNLITCQQSSLFGWSVLNHILHMDGVLADDNSMPTPENEPLRSSVAAAASFALI